MKKNKSSAFLNKILYKYYTSWNNLLKIKISILLYFNNKGYVNSLKLQIICRKCYHFKIYFISFSNILDDLGTLDYNKKIKLKATMVFVLNFNTNFIK